MEWRRILILMLFKFGHSVPSETTTQYTEDTNKSILITTKNLNGMPELSTLTLERVTTPSYDELYPSFVTEQMKDVQRATTRMMRKVLKHIYKQPIHSRYDEKTNRQDVLLNFNNSEKDLLTNLKEKFTDVSESEFTVMNDASATTTSGVVNRKHNQKGLSLKSDGFFIGADDNNMNGDKKSDIKFNGDHHIEEDVSTTSTIIQDEFFTTNQEEYDNSLFEFSGATERDLFDVSDNKELQEYLKTMKQSKSHISIALETTTETDRTSIKTTVGVSLQKSNPEVKPNITTDPLEIFETTSIKETEEMKPTELTTLEEFSTSKTVVTMNPTKSLNYKGIELDETSKTQEVITEKINNDKANNAGSLSSSRPTPKTIDSQNISNTSSNSSMNENTAPVSVQIGESNNNLTKGYQKEKELETTTLENDGQILNNDNTSTIPTISLPSLDEIIHLHLETETNETLNEPVFNTTEPVVAEVITTTIADFEKEYATEVPNRNSANSSEINGNTNVTENRNNENNTDVPIILPVKSAFNLFNPPDFLSDFGEPEDIEDETIPKDSLEYLDSTNASSVEEGSTSMMTVESTTQQSHVMLVPTRRRPNRKHKCRFDRERGERRCGNKSEEASGRFIAKSIFGKETNFSIEVKIQNSSVFVPPNATITENFDKRTLSFTWSSVAGKNNHSLILKFPLEQNNVSGTLELIIVKGDVVRTWTKEFIYPEIKAYDWIVYLDVESRVSLINLNWRNLFDKGENAEADSSKYDRNRDKLFHIVLTVGICSILAALGFLLYFVIARRKESRKRAAKASSLEEGAIKQINL